VVALVATERAVAEGWAPAAAVDLVRSWSGDEQRLVLIDAGLEQPSLHAAVDLPNHEGLSDATLHGASVGRVSRPIEGGGFLLVTAGTPVADASAVVRSPRWYRLTAGMAEAGVTLVLYLRDGDSSTAAFLGSASDIVVLAPEGDDGPSAVRDLEPLVRAVTGPAGGAPVADRVEPSSATSGEGPDREMRRVLYVVIAIVVIAAVGWLMFSGR